MKFEPNKILCFGEVLWDQLPSGAKPGGAPLNVAIHLQRFNMQAVLASKVGNDAEGRRLKEFMVQSALTDAFIQTDDELPTSQVLVHLDKNHQARYEICEPVAWDRMEPLSQLLTEAASCGIIVFGSLASRNPKTRNTLLEILNGPQLKVLDINLRPPYHERKIVEPLLRKAHLVKLNSDELQTIALWNGYDSAEEKTQMQLLTEQFGWEMAVVTRGEKGALVYDGHRFLEHEGFKVRAIDTVGAGDAFLAAFLAGYLNEEPLEEALSMACAAGAFVATQPGATPEYCLSEILGISETQKK